MLKKSAGVVATLTLFSISFGGGLPLYANESMMPAMARELTPEDDALAWTVPANWKEVPASGMRLGSFISADASQAIDVSIVLLGPTAGSVEPNLVRWAGQIQVPADPAAIKKITEESGVVKTGLGREVKVYDFSLLQSKQEGSSKSMIVSIIPLEKATAFIKMAGTIEALAKNKDSFKELVSSIHKK